MSYKIGLVGLPNVGKSSLFHFWTKKNILIANYPFATINPNVGVMPLADSRLEQLGQYWKSQKITPSSVEVIDIAGLVRGASTGAGLGNEFLSHIREVDLICQVLRCFHDPEIVHVEKSVNSIRDYEIIQFELILADLQQVKKRLEKLKIRDKKSQQEKEILELIQQNLEQEILISQLNLSPENQELIKPYNFLTNKPVLIIANYAGDNKEIFQLTEYAQKKGLSIFLLATKLEEELEKLSKEEKKELEITDNDFSSLTNKIKQALNLKTFFTVGKDEVKSWLTKKDEKARHCAGLIHSDIQKNFICVEIYNYNDWKQHPILENLKKSGKLRKEGAEYLVQEGDICHFLFGKN